jgi:hypothetical protein
VNRKDTHVLTIDTTDRDPRLVDFHLDISRPGAAHHRHHRSPACPIAHLDEKQHALAFEMRHLVGACAAPC